MKKLLKKIYFYIYCKYVDIKIEIEHILSCDVAYWNIAKTKDWVKSSYYEPCCEKGWNIHLESRPKSL